MTSTVIQPTYDNGIKPSTDTTYPWNASTGLIDVNFAGTIGTTNAIQFIKDGYQFAWKPDTVEVLDDHGNLTAVSTVNPNATAQVWKNRLTYVGTTPLTSDEFEVQGNQLKHTVRMVAPPSLPSGYTGNPQFLAIGGDIGTTTQDWSDIDLYADGVSHRSDFTTTDDLSFVRISDGTEIYRIPRITVIDANGNETLGEYKLAFQPNNVVTLYLLVSWNWMQNAVYPVAIDPTVVVSSAYDIGGVGGRKIVRLSNNWIVICAYNSNNYTTYFYVSKDNGQTWTQLTYIAATAYPSGSPTIASSGTIVHCVLVWNGAIESVSFDALTVTDTDQSAYRVVVDNSGSSFASPSVEMDGSGYLQLSFSGKSNVYPNSANILYSKGTVSGTTVTWATPTQLTTYNTSGYNAQNPCIVVSSSNNYPLITFDYNGGTTDSIFALVWSGSAWSQILVYNANGYVQSDTCAAIDGNGVIYVGWHGTDATTSNNRAKWSKSTDGGNTWSSMALINSSSTQASTNVSLDARPDNSVDAFWQEIDTSVNATYTQIRRANLAAGGSSFSTPVTVTNSTTANQTNPQTLWSKFNMNSSDAVRYMWMTGSSVEYDQILLNQPPNAPTNLSPTGGATLSSQMPVLSGTFSDADAGNTMSALQVKVYRSSDNTLMWDSTKTAMTTTVDNQNWSIQVPSSANLAYGTQYYWTATTWDNTGTQGAWSGNQVFNLSQAPTVTVTSPTANQTITASSITVQLSYSQASNVAESSYQFQLLDAMGQNVVQDSGTISGKNNMYTFSGLSNNTTYQVVGYATATDGTKGTSSKVSFNTSFTQPATPSVSAMTDGTNAKVSLSLSNPYPVSNLLTANQSNVESGLTGLQAYQASGTPTFIQDTTQHWEGAASAKLTATVNSSITIHTDSTNRVSINGGWPYTFTVHGQATAAAGRTWQLNIFWYDVSGNFIKSDSSIGGTVSSIWQTLELSATSPTNASTCYCELEMSNALSGEILWWDGAQLQAGSNATQFMTGGTGQPNVGSNNIYRRISGTPSWGSPLANVTGATYDDFLVANGVSYDYGVSAMGTNGVESSITSVTATPSFSGDWLYDPTTGKQFPFLYNRAPYDMATMEERQEFQTFGNKPMIRRGPLNARTGTLDALMVQIGSSQSPIQQLQAFEANMANHPAYYLKTAAGEVLKVDVHTPKRKMPQEYLNSQAIGITVNWTEVS